MNFFYLQSDTSKIQLLWALIVEIWTIINGVVNVSANWIVVNYFQTATSIFDNTPTVLASARIMFVCGVVGFTIFSLGEMFEAKSKFTAPIMMRPSLDPTKRESSAAQFFSLVFWFILSLAIIWISIHLMSRLLMPIDKIYALIN